jgi:hypothetical protein
MTEQKNPTKTGKEAQQFKTHADVMAECMEDPAFRAAYAEETQRERERGHDAAAC